MKLIRILALILVLCLLAGCQAKRTVTCDHCGTKITLPKTSNIEEDWIVYCHDCELELFGEDGLIN